MKIINFTNDGFTFTESLVSMLVISIISACFFLCFFTARNSLKRKSAQTNLVYSHLVSDSKIRKFVEGISVPLWKKDIEINFSSNRMEIQFFQSKDCMTELLLDKKVCITNVEKIFASGQIVGLKTEYTIDSSYFSTTSFFSSSGRMLHND